MQRRCSGAIQQIADDCRRPTGPVPPSFASSPCIAALCCILRDVIGHPRPPTLAETTPSAPATLPLSPRICPSLGEEKRQEERLQFSSLDALYFLRMYLILSRALYFLFSTFAISLVKSCAIASKDNAVQIDGLFRMRTFRHVRPPPPLTCPPQKEAFVYFEKSPLVYTQ